MSAGCSCAADTNRVALSPGAIISTRTAGKRRRCDGHLAPAVHYIEAGESITWMALPPHSESGNERWWHAGFCVDCAPASTTGSDQ